MAFWWVNHKQTFKDEIDGRYIWSPMVNKNGSKNQTYLNLTLALPGDIIFSYAHTQIKAIGVVTRQHMQQLKPKEFERQGWNQDGWIVPVDWHLLKQSLHPKSFINDIAQWLPEKYSPIKPNGNGNQGCYLAKIDDFLGEYLLMLASQFSSQTIGFIKQRSLEFDEKNLVEELNNSEVNITVKQQLVEARVGQGQFRSRVIEIYGHCPVTKVSRSDLLIASHIKPWKAASNVERLDGHNGVLLAPHIDKVFDSGFISFSRHGNILFKDDEVKGILLRWGVNVDAEVKSFSVETLHYLEYHRDVVFQHCLPNKKAGV